MDEDHNHGLKRIIRCVWILGSYDVDLVIWISYESYGETESRDAIAASKAHQMESDNNRPPLNHNYTRFCAAISLKSLKESLRDLKRRT